MGIASQARGQTGYTILSLFSSFICLFIHVVACVGILPTSIIARDGTQHHKTSWPRYSMMRDAMISWGSSSRDLLPIFLYTLLFISLSAFLFTSIVHWDGWWIRSSIGQLHRTYRVWSAQHRNPPPDKNPTYDALADNAPRFENWGSEAEGIEWKNKEIFGRHGSANGLYFQQWNLGEIGLKEALMAALSTHRRNDTLTVEWHLRISVLSLAGSPKQRAD